LPKIVEDNAEEEKKDENSFNSFDNDQMELQESDEEAVGKQELN
jgi:hypothetical protein